MCSAQRPLDNLDKHFGNVNKDIEQIVTSAEKILSRGEKIQGVDFNEEPRLHRSSGADDAKLGRANSA